MPAFRFKLQSVLRYRESRRDLCQQYLAQVLADDLALQSKIERLVAHREKQLEELRVLGRAGKLRVDSLTARRYYIGQLSGEVRVVEHQRTILAAQIEMCRKALAQAEKEVKVLERLKEKQEARARAEQILREDREREENWQAIHLREVTI